MKLTHLMMMGAFALGCSNASAQNYQLVWEDNFDGSTLNPSVWNYEKGTGDWGWGNGELQYYTDRTDNVNVANGLMTITCKKEEYNGSHYTSGRIQSRNKVMAKYGKIESLIKVPKGAAGVWPAFWLLGTGNGGGWPQCGEIDIMEMMCTNDAATWNKALTTYHWNTNGVSGASNHGMYGDGINVGEQLGNAWRIYGLEWTPKAMTGYVANADGSNRQNICTIDISSRKGGMEAFTDYEFYIIYNFAFGGTYVENQIDNSFTKDEMQVDWVRIYQDNTTYPTSSITDNSYSLKDIPVVNTDYVKVLSDRTFDGSVTDLSTSAFNIWEKTLNAAAGTAFEGENSLSLNVGNVGWYGGGYVYSSSVYNYDKLRNYTLHFALKTNNTTPFTLTCGGKSIQFTPTKANEWVEYNLPLSSTFPGLSLGTTANFDILSFNQGDGEGAGTGRTFAWDDIYFYLPGGAKEANLSVSSQSNKIKDQNATAKITVSGSNVSGNVTLTCSNANFVLTPSTITPVNGKFNQEVTVKYTGSTSASATITAKSGSSVAYGKVNAVISGVEKVTTDYITLSREQVLDGSSLDWSTQTFNVWSNEWTGNLTMTPGNTAPFEGDNCMSFVVGSEGWYGGGFAVNQTLDYENLSKYKLHFALNSSSTQPISVTVCGNETRIVPKAANVWSEYEIDLSLFGLNLDVANSIEPFSFHQASDEAVREGRQIAFDNIYFYIPGGSGIAAVSATTPGTISGQNGKSSFRVSGNNLTGNVVLSSSNPDFILSSASIAPVNGKVNQEVVITYKGSTAAYSNIKIKSGNLVKTIQVAAFGATTSTECNLVPSFVDGGTYYATTWDWIQITGQEFTVNANSAEIYLPQSTVGDYQAQFWMDPAKTLSLANGETYTAKALVYSNKAVTVRMKVVPRGDDENALVNEKFQIAAYTLTPIEVKSVAGEGMADMRILFDFGGNPEKTTVDIYNVELGLASCYGEDNDDDDQVVPDPEPQPQPKELVNVALGKTATASGVESAAYSAVNAVDGDENTRFASDFTDNAWFVVDLAKKYSDIEKIEIVWEGAYTTSFCIEASVDNVNWTEIKSVNGQSLSNFPYTQTLDINNATARYIRFVSTKRATEWGNSFYEFRVLTADKGEEVTVGGGDKPKPQPTELVNVALGKTATASGVESAAYSAGNAVDGDENTRFASDFTDNAWFVVDLAKQYSDIEKIEIVWEGAYTSSFRIEASVDNVNWTEIKRVNGQSLSNFPYTQTLDINNATARYIRFVSTKRATEWGNSFYEFRVLTADEGKDVAAGRDEDNDDQGSVESPANSGEGVTNEGLRYAFDIKQNGNDVTVTFTALNAGDFAGLVPFMWDNTNGFTEHFTDTYTFSYPAGTKMRIACKWAYAGGMTVTPYIEYTVAGNKSLFVEEDAMNDVVATFAVYPNPAVDYVIVNGSVEGQVVNVYSMSGKCVCSVPAQDGETRVSLAGLGRGIYVVRMGNDTARIMKK
ncbi:MAG: discoidin domain-containing protein [Bacteroidales bacterium]|nr:discoidin domain-containing protein [Bacteroidales bacterium]